MSSSMHRSSRGFTIVEILVAVAVLAMLVVLVAQMVASASVLTAGGHKRMDADDEARLVFDRMAADFSQMVRDPDARPLLINNTDGNDEFYFLGAGPGYFSNNAVGMNSGLTLIGYRVDTNGLSRYAKVQSWDDLSFTNVVSPVINDEYYHVLAPTVFRMEFALLMKQGSTNYNYTNGVVGTNPTDMAVYFKTNSPNQSFRDVAAIQVVLGILDSTSRKIINPSLLADLTRNVTGFPDFDTNGRMTSGVSVGQWISNAPSSITPRAAASQIRIYQRYFLLN